MTALSTCRVQADFRISGNRSEAMFSASTRLSCYSLGSANVGHGFNCRHRCLVAIPLFIFSSMHVPQRCPFSKGEGAAGFEEKTLLALNPQIFRQLESPELSFPVIA